LISDGARNFNDAFKSEFFTISNPRTKHLRHFRWQADHNNNKMERLNGEVRDREKVMRRLKITTTPILPGCQLSHNYIRPHMALKGMTPAGKCGIKIEGDNKWQTLIENASLSIVKNRKNLSEVLHVRRLYLWYLFLHVSSLLLIVLIPCGILSIVPHVIRLRSLATEFMSETIVEIIKPVSNTIKSPVRNALYVLV
jgi:hypothetical protein